MGTAPENIVGYTAYEFETGGAGFWFSLIHPDDITLVSGKIIAAHEALAVGDNGSRKAVPILLRYRLRHLDGHYIRVKDSRFLLSQHGEGVINDILCRIELVGALHGDDEVVQDLLQKKRSCIKILEAAFTQQNAHRKPLLGTAPGRKTQMPNLTPREKQILGMIADGLSSKMIAHQCNISINTVETHRRHLLEKLQVRNSMELIKEASRAFIL